MVSCKVMDHSSDSATSPWAELASVWEDLFALRPERVDMCRSLVEPGQAVLDAGCGTGALVRALVAQGVDAYGFDLDPGFVAHAREQAGDDSGRVVLWDLREISSVLPGKQFGLIVCLGQTFPHLLTDSAVRSFLAGASERLEPGGRLAIQVVADRDEHPVRSLPSLQAGEIRLDRRRILTGPDRVVFELEVHGRTGSLSWKVEQRRWTPDALAGFGISVGLRSEFVWADESKRDWTGAEPGWILVLRKD